VHRKGEFATTRSFRVEKLTSIQPTALAAG
jgi:hypothetical protein